MITKVDLIPKEKRNYIYSEAMVRNVFIFRGKDNSFFFYENLHDMHILDVILIARNP